MKGIFKEEKKMKKGSYEQGILFDKESQASAKRMALAILMIKEEVEIEKISK